MTPTIPLVCGDPGQKPASSTRFALPFGYRLVTGGPDSDNVWRPEPPGDRIRERQRYFTAETARVLFRRARRFVLESDGEPLTRFFEVPKRHGSGVYVAGLAPPQLTLFEWPEAKPAPPSDDEDTDGDDGDLLATGFLVLELRFPDSNLAPDLDELLEINEVFRHCIPPFPEHADDGQEGGGRRGLRTILRDLPVDLLDPAVKVGDHNGPLEEIYFERWSALLDCPIEPFPGERWRLFPASWGRHAREWYDKPLADHGSGWVVYGDGRAFAWTCALVGDGLDGLRRQYGEKEAEVTEARQLGHWVKLLNVDAPGTAPSAATRFEQEQAREGTYERWQERGTVYGFSHHSGALLAPPIDFVPLWRHFGETYFDQTLLLLYVRVTSFRFSRKLSEVTEKARGGGSLQGLRRRFRALRRDFAYFTNLYQFPLLSNQQQGIELYELTRRRLDVDALFAEIQSEVQSTHDFIEMTVAQTHSETATRLTVVATAGLLLSIVVGFFGMNFLVPGTSSGLGFIKELLYFVVGVLAGWIVLGMVSRCPDRWDSFLSLFKNTNMREK